MSNEIYVSIDIESDGTIPAQNSMLSIGNAAFDCNGNLLDTWEANLETLPGAVMDQRTKTEFWDKNPKAWEACRKNLQSPERAMKEYVKWLKELEKKHKGKVVAVCAPSGYDFTFVYWYLMKFAGESPFSFSCIDMKTYAMALLGLPYRMCGKKSYPKYWYDKVNSLKLTHSHVAIEDALEQGYLYFAMRKHQQEFVKC